MRLRFVFSLCLVACGSDRFGVTDGGDVGDSGAADVIGEGAAMDVLDDRGPVMEIGCSDGTREAFVDRGMHPNIAGCRGGFRFPGVYPVPLSTHCGRTAGNSGGNSQGMGCGAADLCAAGWHVCVSAVDLASHSGTAMCDNQPGFWLTSQGNSGPNLSTCTPPGDNNVFGCGTLFSGGVDPTCQPLARRAIYTDGPGTTWHFGDSNGMYIFTEAQIVTNDSGDDGGVICCRD